MNERETLASHHTLPALPYAQDALEPVISRRTVEFHYGKHHRAYVDTLNKLVPGTPFAHESLDDIVKRTARAPEHSAIFNNAGQAWNHAFYWKSLRPAASAPRAVLLRRLEADFGSFEAFKLGLAAAAVGQFGSGWAWLVLSGGRLKLVHTSNADTPLSHQQRPLLAIDVWEHAYYLDYQNARPAYLETFVDKLLNWEFAASNFAI
jgi:Fe-Mn family superoxide dismutase